MVIPKLYDGHNKTFFFVDYEGLRRATTAASNLRDIPPIPFRTGDFSSFTPRIYDPRARVQGANGVVTSTPFPNNQIPASLLNPGRRGDLEASASTRTVGAPNAAAANYLYLASQPFDSDQYDIRADHQFSTSNTLFRPLLPRSPEQSKSRQFSGLYRRGNRQY